MLFNEAKFFAVILPQKPPRGVQKATSYKLIILSLPHVKILTNAINSKLHGG